jgi:muconolactone delta-isomerase
MPWEEARRASDEAYSPKCVEVEFSEVGPGLREVASCLWWKRLPPLAEAGGRRSRSMRFLVTIDGSDIAGMPLERFVQVLDQMVVPGVEKLDQLEQEGRIHGGGYTAGRGGVFIIDADSSEEVDQLLTSLPHWPVVKVDVLPLISTSSLLERARTMRQRVQERVR